MWIGRDRDQDRFGKAGLRWSTYSEMIDRPVNKNPGMGGRDCVEFRRW